MQDLPYLEPEDDIGLLCLVIANGFTEAVLERLRVTGFGDARFSHGFVVQGLLAGDRTITQLAERLGVSVQAVSKTVQEMTRLGYIERNRDPADGRSWVLELTERARASLARAREARFEVEGLIEERLGPEGTAELLRLLRVAAGTFGGLEALANRRVRPVRGVSGEE